MPTLVDWGRLERERADLARRYFESPATPHVVLDGLLDDERVRATAFEEELGAVLRGDQLGRYEYFNQSTESTIGVGDLPSTMRALVEELNGPEWVRYLGAMTGIPDLVPDPDLGNGGIFILRPGGFMNLHRDETIHPFRRNWRRRINLVLYLNRGWKEDYDGHLELFTLDGKERVRKVLPVFNRCFISTVERNVHGMPGVVRCPEGEARKSLALWYYTVEEGEVPFRPVQWKADARDPLARKAAILIEDRLYWAYHAIKWRLGIEAPEGAASSAALQWMDRWGYSRLTRALRSRLGRR